MNIKKIIKEELGDFEWAKEIGPYTEAEQWFKDLLNQMTRSEGGRYFKIKGETFIFYDKKNGALYYDYVKIYSVLESEYNLNYQEITDLVKVMVVRHFNLRGIIPLINSIKNLDEVVRHFNLRGITPTRMFSCRRF